MILKLPACGDCLRSCPNSYRSTIRAILRRTLHVSLVLNNPWRFLAKSTQETVKQMAVYLLSKNV